MRFRRTAKSAARLRKSDILIQKHYFRALKAMFYVNFTIIWIKYIFFYATFQVYLQNLDFLTLQNDYFLLKLGFFRISNESVDYYCNIILKWQNIPRFRLTWKKKSEKTSSTKKSEKSPVTKIPSSSQKGKVDEAAVAPQIPVGWKLENSRPEKDKSHFKIIIQKKIILKITSSEW